MLVVGYMKEMGDYTLSVAHGKHSVETMQSNYSLFTLLHVYGFPTCAIQLCEIKFKGNVSHRYVPLRIAFK